MVSSLFESLSTTDGIGAGVGFVSSETVTVWMMVTGACVDVGAESVTVFVSGAGAAVGVELPPSTSTTEYVRGRAVAPRLRYERVRTAERAKKRILLKEKGR